MLDKPSPQRTITAPPSPSSPAYGPLVNDTKNVINKNSSYYHPDTVDAEGDPESDVAMTNNSLFVSEDVADDSPSEASDPDDEDFELGDVPDIEDVDDPMFEDVKPVKKKKSSVKVSSPLGKPKKVIKRKVSSKRSLVLTSTASARVALSFDSPRWIFT